MYKLLIFIIILIILVIFFYKKKENFSTTCASDRNIDRYFEKATDTANDTEIKRHLESITQKFPKNSKINDYRDFTTFNENLHKVQFNTNNQKEITIGEDKVTIGKNSYDNNLYNKLDDPFTPGPASSSNSFFQYITNQFKKKASPHKDNIMGNNQTKKDNWFNFGPIEDKLTDSQGGFHVSTVYHDDGGRLSNETGFNGYQTKICRPCPRGIKIKRNVRRGYSEKNQLFDNHFGHKETSGNYYDGPEDVDGGTITLGKFFVRNKENGFKSCEPCTRFFGCGFDDEGNEIYDEYESRPCGNGLDRECSKCKDCKFGEQVMVTDCGEYNETTQKGIENNRVCRACKECNNNQFKTAGCENINTIYDTICKDKTNCKGFNELNDKKYYGKRQYSYDNGLVGTHHRSRVEGTQPPYYGRDRMCALCDECPPGTITVTDTNGNNAGCFNNNSLLNNICIRVIDTQPLLDYEFETDGNSYYNLEEIINHFKITKDDIVWDTTNKVISLRPGFENKFERPLSNLNQDILDFYNNEIQLKNDIIRDGNRELMKNINNYNYEFNFGTSSTDKRYFEPMLDLKDQNIRRKILEQFKKDCTICAPSFYLDPQNKGCNGTENYNCIPKTKCNPENLVIIKENDYTKDRECGLCECPEGLISDSPNRLCPESDTLFYDNDKEIPMRYIDTEQCREPLQCEEGEFIYKNVTKYNGIGDNECRKCKECGPNSVLIKKCDKDRSSDTICKEHKICGKNMFVLQKGNSNKDTICACIEGYELPKNKFGDPDINAPDCIPIVGPCQKNNPCPPNSMCINNYNEEPARTQCVCIDGYELSQDGKSCEPIIKKHSHKFHDKTNIKGHLTSNYHSNIYDPNHIHKNYYINNLAPSPN